MRHLKNITQDSGFSLIELVVVIAILSVITAVALPQFSGVRRDAQINQAKNAMASIVKECLVANARKDGAPVDMSTIASAKSSLSGYEIVSLGNGLSAGLGACIKNQNVDQVPGRFITLEALPVEYDSSYPHRVSEIPSFLIEYNVSTGETSKTCYKESVTKYGGDSYEGGGCLQNTTPTLVRAARGGAPAVYAPADPFGVWR